MAAELPSELARRAGIHAALADPHRLRIVDELADSDRSPSELRDALGMGSNLLAHHLDVLERAGLLERVVSAGDARRRYVRLVPEALSAAWAPVAAIAARRVLFVCSANSARSQLAAALWNTANEVPAESAGTEPASRVHPEAIAAAARAGLDLREATPRAMEDVTAEPDLIVTVCDRAHEELGRRRGPHPTLHWSIPDPAPLGTAAAFDDTVRRLARRIDTLAPRVTPVRRRARTRRTHP